MAQCKQSEECVYMLIIALNSIDQTRIVPLEVRLIFRIKCEVHGFQILLKTKHIYIIFLEKFERKQSEKHKL